MRINELWLVYVWFLCKMPSMAIMKLVEETLGGFFSERHTLKPEHFPPLKKVFIYTIFISSPLFEHVFGLYILESFVAAIELNCLEIC